MRSLLIIILFSSAAIAQSDFDNRRPKSVVGVSIPIPLQDEVEILDSIQRSQDQELLKALERPPHSQSFYSPLRLQWNKRISLKDADYILCLFDATGRSEPGDNPRILVLFSLDYQVRTWGAFKCEPRFDYGTIINPIFSSPDTYFVTVNPSGRNGGHLWFEKYRITPTLIEKLGEGPELTQIKP